MKVENKAATRRRIGGALMALALLGGCGPNPYDLYLQAMRAQGAAERGSCKLQFDKNIRSHTTNSGQVTRCIRDMDEVLGLYEKAQRGGYEGKELDRALLKVQEDLKKLRSMQAMVSEMEESP